MGDVKHCVPIQVQDPHLSSVHCSESTLSCMRLPLPPFHAGLTLNLKGRHEGVILSLNRSLGHSIDHMSSAW